MNLFTRLPITLASSLYPVIQESEIEYFVDYEPLSYEHWIFNQGGASGLVGRKSGKSLMPASTAPAYSSSYLTMSNAVGKGLLTDMLEPANAKYTAYAVVRDPTAGTATLKVPFGTLNVTSGGNGGAPLISGGAAARKLYHTYLGVTGSVDTLQAAPGAQWLFIGVSIDFSGGTKRIKSLVGGAAGHESVVASTFTASPRAIALGNGYYTAGYDSNLDFADFILFDGSHSIAEMQAVYLRRKAKLAASGIAVV